MQEKNNMIRAELLSVGTELLLGDILNTNARFLSRELAALGVGVYYQTTTGDNADRLRQAVRIALARSEMVIITGGLGPTGDDLTKETVASVLGLPMEEDENIWQDICDYFARTGRSVSENNRKQAMIPQGATVLENENGTAPGLIIEKDGKTLILLPGPPSEMQPMFTDRVAPYLIRRSGQVLVSRYLEVCGIGESNLEGMVEDLLLQEDPTVALYAKTGRVEIRITAAAASEREGEKKCAAMEKEIRARLGKYVYSDSRETPEEALVALLKQKGLTLATAESCTGGLIAKKITDVPGASCVLEEAFVTYSDRAKQAVLGVSPWILQAHSAVSGETAAEMAKGALTRSGADLSVAVTGYAGPEGDPVGLVWLAVADKTGVYVKKLLTGHEKDRKTIRELAAVSAISMVRDLILNPQLLSSASESADPSFSSLSYAAEYPRSVAPKKAKTGSFWRRVYEYFIPLKSDHRREWIRKLVMLVAVPTFIISALVLLNSYLQGRQAIGLLEEMRENYNPDEIVSISQQEKDEIQYPADYQDSFFQLYSINNDVKGYIKVEGTKIDFPIVQAADNDYYLRRNFKGQKNDYGVCYFDYRCNIKTPSDNLIMYAHNMKDQEMFGTLTKYQKVSYYQQHPLISMDSVYKNGDYVIIGAFLSNAETKDGPVFDYHNRIRFDNQEAFDSFISGVKRRSWIDTGIDVRYGDELITLSTCSYEVSSGRFVVVARRLREGESSVIDVTKARQKSASEILYPLAYYKKNKLDIPKEYEGLVDEVSSETEKPSEKPSQNEPSSVGEESASRQESSSVSETPSVTPPPVDNPSDAPSETPSVERPSESVSDTPSEQVSGEAPSETPSEEVSGETPSETPSEEVSSETPSEEVSGETPSETPSEGASSETPSEEIPSETPSTPTEEESSMTEELSTEEPAA